MSRAEQAADVVVVVVGLALVWAAWTLAAEADAGPADTGEDAVYAVGGGQ